MDEFGIAKLDARLMHLRLDQWRVEADEFAREEQHKKKKAKTGKNAEEISALSTASTSVEDMIAPPVPPRAGYPRRRELPRTPRHSRRRGRVPLKVVLRNTVF